MKTWIALFVAVLSQAAGNVLLSRAMRALSAGGVPDAADLPGLLARAAGMPSVWLGVAFLVLFFAIFAATLSRDDLTFVMPAVSMEVVVNVAFAALLLGEAVSPQRWLGAGLAAVGIGLVGSTRSGRGGAGGSAVGGEPSCRS